MKVQKPESEWTECKGCQKDWGHSYCGDCNGAGSFPTYENPEDVKRWVALALHAAPHEITGSTSCMRLVELGKKEEERIASCCRE